MFLFFYAEELRRGDTLTLFRPAGALKPEDKCNSYQDSAPLGLYRDLDFNAFALGDALTAAPTPRALDCL